MLLNEELNLACPEGFREMDQAERAKLNMLKDGEGVCLTDPARHTVLSVGWKRTGRLLSFLASAEDSAKSMEHRIAKAMAVYGYRSEGFLSGQIDGAPAKGFRYVYTAQGVEMCGESWAVKHGKTFYYLHVYLRAALREESLACWDAILEGLRWQ